MSRKRETIVRKLLEQNEKDKAEIKALRAERKTLNKEIATLRKSITKRPPLVVKPD